MELTPELKAEIDALDAARLRRIWDTTPLDNPLLCGESGVYWVQRMLDAEREAAEKAANAFSGQPLLSGASQPDNATDAIPGALTGPVGRVDPASQRMGYAQKLVLLDQLLDAATQQLCDEFGVDAQTMAAVLNKVQGRWIMSMGAEVALR